jgi:hypothetical protein
MHVLSGDVELINEAACGLETTMTDALSVIMMTNDDSDVVMMTIISGIYLWYCENNDSRRSLSANIKYLLNISV